MPKRTFTRKKEDIHKINESINKEREIVEKALPPIVRDTGGSLSNIKNKSLYFNKWVQNLQENVNPLIGKHVEAAPEYTVNTLMLDQKVEELSESMRKVLDQGVSAYDPSKDLGDEMEELEKSPKNNDTHDTNFIDINIIENTTRKLFNEDEEDLINSCLEEMKTYHDDVDYVSEIEVKSVIENYKHILVLEYKEKKRLLENKKSQDTNK